jgi:hypothetical protein
MELVQSTIQKVFIFYNFIVEMCPQMYWICSVQKSSANLFAAVFDFDIITR